ncbi:MAG TPA: trypsin-like serine protease [Xanthobacteraceae bacterium]|jgi:V8-like Glu-specific endopeptidase|nr:trypsin-like serine protease [Xanthobacteraceae bacterium]
MVAKLYFPGRALLFMAIAIAAAVTAGPVRAQTKPIGKLFTSSGTCSASVVSGNNVIVTAGHCCWDRTKNNWIGGWSFAPAYNNGNAPYGVFNWASATILNSWINNGDIPSDVCVIKLQNDSAGHPVTYYTGWLGRSWNYPPVQNMHAFGYPGNIGGANSLESCAAQSSAQPASCGSGVLNMACNMTFGSSGGPWIKDLGSGNHVDATVHGYISQACTGPFGQEFNGPQFTSNNIVPVCNAQGC